MCFIPDRKRKIILVKFKKILFKSIFFYTFTIMKPKAIVKIITNDGWYKVSQKGSHAQFKHSVKKAG